MPTKILTRLIRVAYPSRLSESLARELSQDCAAAPAGRRYGAAEAALLAAGLATREQTLAHFMDLRENGRTRSLSESLRVSLPPL